MRRVDLEIYVEQRGTDCVVELLRDSLMHGEAPEFAEAFVREVIPKARGCKRVVVDFQNVVHMNSNAVSVLLLVKSGLEHNGKGMALTAVRTAIANLFQYMCLGDTFQLVGEHEIGAAE